MLEKQSDHLPEASYSKPSYDQALEAFYGDWVWRATYALIDHQDFQWSPAWIAEKLGVSKTEAMDAIIGLTDLGLIRKTESGFEQGQLQVIIPEGTINKNKQINQHQLLSEEIINQLKPEKTGFYYNYFSFADKELVDELYLELKSVIENFFQKNDVKKSKKGGVVAFSFTAVDVTSGNEGGQS
jgi:DNA-binding Lrp family transcriptional regulator